MFPRKQQKMAQQIMEAFTRQHYTAIATIIKESRDANNRGGNSMADYIADELAVMFKNDNPGFDKDRFLKACGS